MRKSFTIQPFYRIVPAILLLLAVSNGKAQTQILVLNKSDNTLSVLNPDNLATLFQVPTDDSPHELVAVPAKQLAIVANYGSQHPGNTLSIIDLNEKKEIRKIDLGAILKPHGLDIRDNSVFFTAERSRLVGRLNLSSFKVDWIQGTGQNGTHLLKLHPDGKSVYTSNRLSNTVSRIVIDGPDQPEFIQLIPVGLKPEGIDISPDGREVWVGSNDEGRITILDAATNKKITELQAGGMPIRIKFSPNQSWVLVSDAKNEQVLLFDSKTKKHLASIKPGGVPMGIIIAKDNKTAYVALSSTNEVIKLSLPDLRIVARGKTGNNPDGIALVY